MRLTRDDLLRITHVRSAGVLDDKRTIVTGVSTDSRSVQRGDLFVAIRGEQFDGHNFLSNAIHRGAVVVVVDQRWAEANEAMLVSMPVPKIVVADTSKALGELARIHRSQFRLPVIAVGGSNGKTTTKEMMKAVLGRKYRVLATEGNLNNHLGVPQTLFRLDADHQIAVVEIGTNHPGEIAYLCDILQPTHGLITNVGREHMEFFRTLDGVADAEAELWSYLREHKGTAFVNADDALLVKRAKPIQKRTTFGITARTPHVKGRIKRSDERGCATITVTPAGKKPVEIALPVPGTHNAMNAVAAAAVGFAMRVPAKEIVAALAGFSAAPKRMQVQQIAGVTILNDTYNSNPDSALAALATLKSVGCSGKRIAVLADMLELGAESEVLHQAIGEAIAYHGVDVLLTYGPLSEHTHRGATVPLKVHYDQKNILAEYLLEELTAGDAVLIKGSRGMRMEDVVTFLAERLPLKGQA